MSLAIELEIVRLVRVLYRLQASEPRQPNLLHIVAESPGSPLP